jgi:hypothetical protein
MDIRCMPKVFAQAPSWLYPFLAVVAGFDLEAPGGERLCKLE